MVQRVITEMIDDLDDKSRAVETVSFGLRGRQYEIDLNLDHAEELDEALAKFVDAARITMSSRRTPATPSRRATPSKAHTKPIAGASASQVRAWAFNNGFTLNPNGRVPTAIVEAYNSAHSTGEPS